MKKYYSCYNNGVTAIISEEVLLNLEKFQYIQCYFIDEEKNRLYSERNLTSVATEGLQHLIRPVFTFARTERVKNSPWFTGENEILYTLVSHIRKNGDDIKNAGFHVPFSNGMELGVHGAEVMKGELSFVTTEQQFRETFGISLAELKQQAHLSKTDEEVRQANAQVFGDNHPVR